MKSSQVRQTFFDFFESKEHKIVPSAPMVVRNDPSLMFTNAGMNQFKDIFLGTLPAKDLRIADTQKCLRVSGKHNDLEEVGHDTYHHTMFEMLGNWSFGDYFKKEAIQWAWELLTQVYGIDPENLYTTVFGGDEQDGLPKDNEALGYWRAILPDERILFGSRKDNFWEMGETGPCGPCSEIHIDMRSPEDKAKIPGKELVNTDHPEVIEIWNLVFIEYNRQSGGKLDILPQKHIDTGMGFERLCMVIQGKTSNYDTDIFQPVILKLSGISKLEYGKNSEQDIAMRVVADHLRAVAFAIADGQLPGNTGAGYVIRRILRRAIRYGYTFLGLKDPFINELLPVLVDEMGGFFPEITAQRELIRKVITEEELAFLRTLSQGIRKFDQYLKDHREDHIIDGNFAFELFDTYGFPVDLTQLMAGEKGWKVDMEGFRQGLDAQRNRSRQAAQMDVHDWTVLETGYENTEFIGYDHLEADVEIVKYRKVKARKKEFYEIVFNKTPFYAESGGQTGDSGYLLADAQKIVIEDTYKEHELIIHKASNVPGDLSVPVKAVVDAGRRRATAGNHSATHLMHAALRTVLGDHVEQKGSLVDEDHLRFDFSHFSKLTDEEIKRVEKLVNLKIREDIALNEKKDVPFKQAVEMGAMALFGEKYGDHVRVVIFDKDYSVELCGGTHVSRTGQIGLFKIISESAIAAGVRRIEAVTAEKAEDYIYEQKDVIDAIQENLKNVKDLARGVSNLVEENKALIKQLESLGRERVNALKGGVIDQTENINGVNFIALQLDADAKTAKDLAFVVNSELKDLFLLIGTLHGSKVNLSLMISEELVKQKGWHAGNIIRELAKEIKGGGGGQPHFATAGGSDPNGMGAAFTRARKMVEG